MDIEKEKREIDRPPASGGDVLHVKLARSSTAKEGRHEADRGKERSQSRLPDREVYQMSGISRWTILIMSIKLLFLGIQAHPELEEVQ